MRKVFKLLSKSLLFSKLLLSFQHMFFITSNITYTELTVGFYTTVNERFIYITWLNPPIVCYKKMPVLNQKFDSCLYQVLWYVQAFDFVTCWGTFGLEFSYRVQYFCYFLFIALCFLFFFCWIYALLLICWQISNQ